MAGLIDVPTGLRRGTGLIVQTGGLGGPTGSGLGGPTGGMPSTSYFLLEDGTSRILLEDGTSKLELES